MIGANADPTGILPQIVNSIGSIFLLPEIMHLDWFGLTPRPHCGPDARNPPSFCGSPAGCTSAGATVPQPASGSPCVLGLAVRRRDSARFCRSTAAGSQDPLASLA